TSGRSKSAVASPKNLIRMTSFSRPFRHPEQTLRAGRSETAQVGPSRRPQPRAARHRRAEPRDASLSCELLLPWVAVRPIVPIRIIRISFRRDYIRLSVWIVAGIRDE